MSETLRVGMIGLGLMGAGMAQNLLAAGHDLVVYNRTTARADALVAAGATRADSPRVVAQSCDVIVVCVSDTPDVVEVVTGSDGISSGAQPGSLVIDCSTISPEVTRDLATALAANDVAFVDAPVSGGSEGAAQGTLSTMVGGSPKSFARAKPVLEAFSARITHVGDVGAGQATKLVNQILVVGNMLAAAEALSFAAANGLDLDRTLEAVTGGAAGSWMLANRGPQVIDRDWRPGFTIDLQCKDLDLVMDTAASCGVGVPLTAAILQLYRTLQAAGVGGAGNHALAQAVERITGVEAVRHQL